MDPLRIVDGSAAPLAWDQGLSLVYVAGGSPVVSLGDRRFSLIGSGLFCFNETERPEIDFLPESPECSIRRVYFLPQAINSQLDLSNIRERPAALGPTASLDRDFLKPFIERGDRFGGYIPVGENLGRRIASLIDSLENELAEKKDSFWPCRSRSFFLELLFLAYKEFLDGDGLPQGLTFSGDESLAGRVIRYVNRNYEKTLTLPDLCARFNTNRTTLAEAVKGATGTTVTGYVNRTRVNAASLILRDTNLPVSEIMERTGFGDMTHFARVFRKATGMSPSEYRKLNGGKTPRPL